MVNLLVNSTRKCMSIYNDVGTSTENQENSSEQAESACGFKDRPGTYSYFI